MTHAIGFTGTQLGMTDAQKARLRTILQASQGVDFHHGDCIGADVEAHDIALELGLIPVIHPPQNPSKRAFKPATTILPTKDYLDRNHDIVDGTLLLIACPKEPEEQLRSGTWATIRYAKKTNKNIYIIIPDGTRFSSLAHSTVLRGGS